MSGPPPLPPGPSGEGPPSASPAPPPPPPVRAESLWEFHADERIVEAGFGLDGRIRVIDALGAFTLLEPSGRRLHAARCDVALTGAALTPSGSAVLLSSGEDLIGLDEQGTRRFEARFPGATCVGANARAIAVGSERMPVHVLSPAGRPRASCVVHHPVSFVAPCTPEGHVVALSQSGQFSVVLGDSVLWRLHLRSTATALAVTDAGLFAIAHRDGAQVFTVEGTMLGLFDVGRPLRGASLASDAPVLLLLDDEERMHLVDLASGYSTWRETRPRGQSLVRLSRDGTRGLAVSRAGGLEMLGFARGAGRAERLEIAGAGVPGDGIWRHVTAVLEDVEPSARVAVDPQGTLIALTRDEGARVELRDRAGGLVGSLPGARDVGALHFSSDGGRVLIQCARQVVSCARGGGDRFEIAGAFSHVLPGSGTSMVLVASSPPSIRMQQGPNAVTETRLPGAPVQVLGAPDLSRVVVADASGALTFWAAGHAPWRRPHEARAGSLALGGPGLVLVEGPDVVGLTLDGREAFRARTERPVELVLAGTEVLAREASNRFFRIGGDGRLVAADARPNLGRSCVLVTPGGALELNVNGRVLTAFHADGRIAWRCEAPDVVPMHGLIARPGLLVFRAGSRLCLLALGGPGPSSDAASRAAFLEL